MHNPEIKVVVYIVLTHSHDVLTATESKAKAEIYRAAYDRFNEPAKMRAKVRKRVVLL